MVRKVFKTGNSTVISIPKEALEYLGLKEGTGGLGRFGPRKAPDRYCSGRKTIGDCWRRRNLYSPGGRVHRAISSGIGSSFKRMKYLTAEQILFLHARLIEETGGSHGVRDINLLLSAVGRPQASFDDQDLYPDIFTKAAALMDSLIRNHPFIDGNKRTGISAAGLFLSRNGYRLTASNTGLETLTLSVARSEKSIPEIAGWFRDHSKPV